MDHDAFLRRLVRNLAEGVEKYGREQGWSRDDYRFYFRPNPDWDYVDVLLVSQNFDSGDYSEHYRAIRRFLQATMRDEPRFDSHYGLSLRTPKQVAGGGIYAIDPAFRDYGEMSPVARSY